MNNLENLLIKKKEETLENFLLRSAYTKFAVEVYGKGISPCAAVLIGEMAANKALYGITYPESFDVILKDLNIKLNKK